MPTVKTVSVTYGRKINLGNYQSAELSVTIWADLDEDEIMDAAMRQLWQAARDNIRAESLRLQGKTAESEAVWRGLPDDYCPVDDSEGNFDPKTGMPFGDK